MAAPLTAAQRDIKQARAYTLSLRGYAMRDIAADLGVNVHTAARLVHRERLRVREVLDANSIDSYETFAGEQNAVAADAWRRLEHFDLNSPATNVVGLQSNILAASVNKAKAAGVFVERTEQVTETRTVFTLHIDRLDRGSNSGD